MNKLEELIDYLNNNINQQNIDNPIYGNVYFVNKKISKHKKNVLLVSHEMKNTGAPIVLLDMGVVLKKLGYNVIVISLENGVLIDSFIKSGIPVIVSSKMKKYQLSKTINKNVRFIVDDIIDYFDFSIFNTLTLFNYIKRYDGKKNKIIWWIHEGNTILDIPELKGLYPRKLNKNIHVYCVSNYCKKLMEDRGFKYDYKLLCYGVKRRFSFKFSHNKKNSDIKVFLNIGTITYRKGQKVLIDAIKSMPCDINDKSRYIFIGKANEDDEYGMLVLKELKELVNGTNIVSYYESMPHNEILNLYSKVDALIVPSFDDPLPVVATECMMMRKNVICSDSTGTASLFDDNNSFIFKTGDYLDLMDKISLFHEDNNLVKNNKKIGYKLFNKYFKYNVFIKSIKKMIKDLKR